MSASSVRDQPPPPPPPQQQQQSSSSSLPADAEAAARSTSSHNEPLPTSSSSHHSDPSPSLPPFEPLFTLVSNATTGTTIHPRVRYLFSDDDPSELTAPPAPAQSPSSSSEPQAQAQTQPRGRALVVDLAPTAARDAWAVSWASSLGADFAVTGAQLAVQRQEEGSAPTTMLRVEGVEREPVDGRAAGGGGDDGSLPSSRSEAAVGREDVDGLVDEFRRRMGVLKKVVGEGEKRREIVGREVEERQAGEEEAAQQGAEETAEHEEDD